MSEERRMILEMLRDGAIDVDEAERLLGAIPDAGNDNGIIVGNADAGRGVNPKRLRINVTEDGRAKVNMKVPFSLVRAGFKMAQTIGPRYAEEAKALEDIDIDEILDSLSAGEIALPYTILEADDEEKGERVEIVLE